jgi:hypothetical protein
MEKVYFSIRTEINYKMVFGNKVFYKINKISEEDKINFDDNLKSFNSPFFIDNI